MWLTGAMTWATQKGSQVQVTPGLREAAWVAGPALRGRGCGVFSCTPIEVGLSPTPWGPRTPAGLLATAQRGGRAGAVCGVGPSLVSTLPACPGP